MQTTYDPLINQIITTSGVTVNVAPLSPHTLIALREKANELFPDPDTAPYMLPVPNAAMEGDMYLDKDNPEYRRLLEESASARTEWMLSVLEQLALEFPDGKEALIERFAGNVEKLRDLLGVEGDDWEITYRHCILASTKDSDMLIKAAQNSLPLTPDEVESGRRLFRYYVSRPPAK